MPQRQRRQPHALSAAERRAVLGVLSSDRFADAAAAQVWATLLDEGTYLALVSTMYRLLREGGQARDRRRQARHPAHVKPELVATGPNQVWSWDITKLRGPAKWTSFYLYVVLDVFSREVVGWLLAARESATLAERLLAETITRERVDRGPAHDPRRPRHLYGQQAGRAATGRPRRHQKPQPAPRQQRQPLQ